MNWYTDLPNTKTPKHQPLHRLSIQVAMQYTQWSTQQMARFAETMTRHITTPLYKLHRVLPLLLPLPTGNRNPPPRPPI
jgi:hypothetical protein